MLALAGASGAQAAAWLPPTTVSTPQTVAPCGFLCGQPGAAGTSVAVAPNGTAVAAWTRNDGAGEQIVQASIRPPGGSFGPPQDVGMTDPNYFLGIFGPSTSVAIDAQGTAVLVYAGREGGQWVTRASVRPAGGSFGTPVALSNPATNIVFDSPTVSMGPDGHAVVAWASQQGPNLVIEASSRPPGGSFGPLEPLSVPTPSASLPRAAVGEQGAAAVIWIRENVIQARVRPAGGGFAPTRDLSAVPASSPDVAIDAQGRATGIWMTSDAGDEQIEARSLTASGDIASGVDVVSDPARNAAMPRVALAPDGTAGAVWTDCASGTVDADCSLRSAARPPGGTFGTPAPVAPVPGLAFPSLGLDAGGSATVGWSEGPGEVNVVRGAPGGAFSEPAGVSSPTPGTLSSLDMAFDDEGSAVADWVLTAPDPPGTQQVDAAAYDAGAPALTSVSVPASATVGAAVGMSVAAADRFSGATVGWSFGDGTGAPGSSVTHAYPNPGRYTVTVTATDSVGNARSVSRSIDVVAAAQPPPPPPPKRVVGATDRPKPKFKVRGKRTTITRLRLSKLPSGARVRVICRGKRCPFKAKRLSAKGPKLNVLRKLQRKQRRLRAGQTLELRVTKAGFTGKVFRYKIRKGKQPRRTVLCLPPGAKRPQRC